MTNPSADIPSGAPAKRTQRIDRDLHCVRCEYNLRTLTPDARCPECALPVADSLRDEIDPLRKRRLRRYVGLYLLGSVLSLLSSLLSDGGYLAFRLNDGTPVMLIEWPSTILRWTVVLIGSVAILQLARRRMLARGGPQYPVLRGILRLGVIYTLMFQSIGWWLISMLIRPPTLWNQFFVYGCSLLIRTMLLLLLLRYLCSLLTPCPHAILRRLQWWAGLLIAQVLIPITIWSVIYLGDLNLQFFTINAGDPFPSVGDVVQLCFFLIQWAVIIAGIVALLAIRRHLARAAGVPFVNETQGTTATSHTAASRTQWHTLNEGGGDAP